MMFRKESVPEPYLSTSVVEYIISSQLSYSIDYNDAARIIISTGLGEVPEVGFVLSALVDIFWPASEQDVWSEVKEKVETLINEKIADLVYQQVKEALDGLHNNIKEYLWAIKYSQDNKTYISEKYNVALGQFIQQLPHFQSHGYELLLLPLFAQFANMHLGLLRDGILYGASWGWTSEIQNHNQQKILDTISRYTTYTETTYSKGLQDLTNKTPGNKHFTEPFNTINRYKREMRLTVLDFSEMWQYFAPIKYPNPVKVYLDREIYSDAVGTADNSGSITLPTKPTKPITRIEVWGWDRIDACQVTYPENGGPDGITQTQRMGDQSGGSSSPPLGGLFDLTQKGAIISVKVRSGDILNVWWFIFQDGSSSNQLGGNYPGGEEHTFSYSNHILSSIKIMGTSQFYRSADCAVFGFKFNQNPTLPEPSILRTMYVASPTTVTPKKLAKYIGSRNTDQNTRMIQNWIKDYHWDTLRERRWSRIREQYGATK